MKNRSPGKSASDHEGLPIPGKHQVAVYLRKWLSVILEAAVLLAVTTAVYTGVLYACKASWHLYLSTHVGKLFLQYYPQAAQGTADLLQMDLIGLSLRITLHAFAICVAIGFLCRLLYVSRYVHERYGLPGRVIVCGLPLTFLVASYTQPLFGFREWSTAFTAALLPTLFVFNSSFNYAAKLLPELGDLKRGLVHRT